MPVDFAAPVTHAATPQNALFGAPPIVFIVVLRQHGFLHPRVGVCGRVRVHLASRALTW
jgi:hypothetical protein